MLNGTSVEVPGGKSWLSPEPCTGDVVSTKSQNLQSSSLGRWMVEEGGQRGQSPGVPGHGIEQAASPDVSLSISASAQQTFIFSIFIS